MATNNHFQCNKPKGRHWAVERRNSPP